MSEIDYGARARLDYIETQLQALFPDSYVPFAEASTSGMPSAVVALARAGNMIAAIKEYRSITGAGLATAWRTLPVSAIFASRTVTAPTVAGNPTERKIEGANAPMKQVTR